MSNNAKIKKEIEASTNLQKTKRKIKKNTIVNKAK